MAIDVLQPDVSGIVSSKFARVEIVKYMRESVLVGFVPQDGVQHGIYSGYAEEWAEYFVSEIDRISNFNSYLYDTRNNTVRVGLFALDPRQVGLPALELFNPRKNIVAGLGLYARAIKRTNRIVQYK